jgi:DNA-binding CsgD family transcriptional regulator
MDDGWAFLRDAPGVRDLTGLNALFERVVSSCGFSFAAHLRLASRGLVEPHPISGIDNLEWYRRYAAQGYKNIDAAIPAAFLATRPITWAEVEAKAQNPAYRTMIGEAREIWAAEALIIPVRGPLGSVSVVNLMMDRQAEVHSEVRTRMMALGALYSTLANALISDPAPALSEPLPNFSKRELQCVYWASQGKSDVDIGTILDIHPRTAHKYVENAKRKLGVSSRLHLALKAWSAGLLVPDVACST